MRTSKLVQKHCLPELANSRLQDHNLISISELAVLIIGYVKLLHASTRRRWKPSNYHSSIQIPTIWYYQSNAGVILGFGITTKHLDVHIYKKQQVHGIAGREII